MNGNLLPPSARAVAAAISVHRQNEAGAAILAANALCTLRDSRLSVALDARDLAALVARDLPSLDRVSARALLRIGDMLSDTEDPGQYVILGLSKLTTLSAAHPGDRDEILPIAEMAPRHELRRQLASVRDERLAAAARSGMPLAHRNDPFSPRVDAPPPATDVSRIKQGRSVLAALGRSWHEMGAEAFAIARTLASLRGTMSPDALTAFAQAELDMDRDEVTREMNMFDLFGLAPFAIRERIGITALRAVASLDPSERRDVILAAAIDSSGPVGDALIARCRPLAAPLTTVGEIGAKLVDIIEPQYLPFNILYLSDSPPNGPYFPDATPEELVEQVLLRTSSKGDLVYDLTAGIGTVARAGERMGRHVVSYDLIDPPLADGIRVGDARSVEPPEGPARMVLLHLPTPGQVSGSERYGSRAAPGDLALYEADTYSRIILDVFRHARKLLVPQGHLVVIAAEARWRGELIDWPGRLCADAVSCGYSAVDRIYAIRPPGFRRTLLDHGGTAAMRDRRSLLSVLVAAIFVTHAHLGDRK